MAKRKPISAPDIIEHPQPFPTAVKVGNVVFSSAIGGHDPQSHEMPEDIESQVANAFQTARRIMEEAGGSTDDIGKIVVFMGDRLDRIAQLKPAMYLRSIAGIFMDVSLNPHLASAILSRIRSFNYGYAERILDASNGKVDIGW